MSKIKKTEAIIDEKDISANIIKELGKRETKDILEEEALSKWLEKKYPGVEFRLSELDEIESKVKQLLKKAQKEEDSDTGYGGNVPGVNIAPARNMELQSEKEIPFKLSTKSVREKLKIIKILEDNNAEYGILGSYITVTKISDKGIRELKEMGERYNGFPIVSNKQVLSKSRISQRDEELKNIKSFDYVKLTNDTVDNKYIVWKVEGDKIGVINVQLPEEERRVQWVDKGSIIKQRIDIDDIPDVKNWEENERPVSKVQKNRTLDLSNIVTVSSTTKEADNPHFEECKNRYKKFFRLQNPCSDLNDKELEERATISCGGGRGRIRNSNKELDYKNLKTAKERSESELETLNIICSKEKDEDYYEDVDGNILNVGDKVSLTMETMNPDNDYVIIPEGTVGTICDMNGDVVMVSMDKGSTISFTHGLWSEYLVKDTKEKVLEKEESAGDGSEQYPAQAKTIGNGVNPGAYIKPKRAKKEGMASIVPAIFSNVCGDKIKKSYNGIPTTFFIDYMGGRFEGWYTDQDTGREYRKTSYDINILINWAKRENFKIVLLDGAKMNKRSAKGDETPNNIPGGMAEKKRLTVNDVDKKQLEKGIKVEMEHTDDISIATEIALDHLSEDSQYYIPHLEDAENQAIEDGTVDEKFVKEYKDEQKGELDKKTIDKTR